MLLCFGVFFCKHTPSVLSSWYVICGTVPSTCLKWNSMKTLIFVINEDPFSSLTSVTMPTSKAKQSGVTICLRQEILIHLSIREQSKVVFVASTIWPYLFSWWISCYKITSCWRNEMRFKDFFYNTEIINSPCYLIIATDLALMVAPWLIWSNC